MHRLLLLLLLLSAISFAACKSDYEKMVDRELSSGKRNDDLFFGMHFGMTRDSFFRHCLLLNANKTISNGPTNATALYKVPNSNMEFNFYPKFSKADKIYLMETTFNYVEWAPWATQYHSDKIVNEAIAFMQKWYPGEFTHFKKDNKEVWVQINGNRQIKGYIKNTQHMQFDIRDLTVKE